MRVECRSDHNYEGTPTAFWLEGERVSVLAVVAEWREPEGKFYRVMSEHLQVFDLQYNENLDDWSIYPVSPRKGE